MKKNYSTTTRFSPLKKKSSLLLVFLFALSGLSNAQELQKTIPNYYADDASSSFLGPFRNTYVRQQYVINENQLFDLEGKDLVSIAYRLPASATSDLPSSEITYDKYEIYLAESVPATEAKGNFDQNIIGEKTKVRSGSLKIPANSLTAGKNPNDFSFDITFDSPWHYKGGNLAIEIIHGASEGEILSVDAVGKPFPAYNIPGDINLGRLYASFTSTNEKSSSGSSLNFSILNIKAKESLSTNEFAVKSVSIYPNPVSSTLTIDSKETIEAISVSNVLGQTVFSSKNIDSKSYDFNASGLNKGNYVVQVQTDSGVKAYKFIKE